MAGPASPFLEQSVSALLERHADTCRRKAYCHWRLRIGGARQVSCAVELDGNWLLLEAVPDHTGGTNPWQLLRWNADLPGLAKFAIGPGTSNISVRAELPVESDSETGEMLGETLAGLAAAHDLLRGECPGAGAKAAVAAGGFDGVHPEMAGNLRRSGWSVHDRAGGSLVVDLETPGRFHQATIERAPGQPHTRVSFAYRDCGQAGELQRKALAAFLLRVNGAIRMVRACVSEADGRAQARCEVMLSAEPLGWEIDRALPALSAAAMLSGLEAELMANDEVARRYLAAIKAPRGRKGVANNNERH